MNTVSIPLGYGISTFNDLRRLVFWGVFRRTFRERFRNVSLWRNCDVTVTFPEGSNPIDYLICSYLISKSSLKYMNPYGVGEITTSRKSVVSHKRKQISTTRWMKQCVVPRHLGSLTESWRFLILGLTPDIVAGAKWQKCGLKYVIHTFQVKCGLQIVTIS